ncbi:hypothetical protein DQM28_12845 [Leptospira mayottensis]|uniref:Uncharacterized protein n=1 Tax=Leptospira mayottensis TaxID=1137606 RepID=A0ABM6YDF4_9LEPT|nr:hypothetical protein DQM28_12845 [Leptospira mayottensis]
MSFLWQKFLQKGDSFLKKHQTDSTHIGENILCPEKFQSQKTSKVLTENNVWELGEYHESHLYFSFYTPSSLHSG